MKPTPRKQSGPMTNSNHHLGEMHAPRSSSRSSHLSRPTGVSMVFSCSSATLVCVDISMVLGMCPKPCFQPWLQAMFHQWPFESFCLAASMSTEVQLSLFFELSSVPRLHFASFGSPALAHRVNLDLRYVSLFPSRFQPQFDSHCRWRRGPC